MPESLIALTEGAGKNLHTFQRVIGTNTVEDQGVLLGENYLASYSGATQVNAFVSLATANSHLLQIMAGTLLKVRVRRIQIFQAAAVSAAAIADIRIYRLSTAGTGGTAITISPLDPTDAAAGATAMTLPTVKGTEGAAIDLATPYLMQTIAASNQLINPIVTWDFDRPRSKPLIIAAGVANGIAIKNINAIAGANTVTLSFLIDETNF